MIHAASTAVDVQAEEQSLPQQPPKEGRVTYSW
jgi:hypothetical protein